MIAVKCSIGGMCDGVAVNAAVRCEWQAQAARGSGTPEHTARTVG